MMEKRPAMSQLHFEYDPSGAVRYHNAWGLEFFLTGDPSASAPAQAISRQQPAGTALPASTERPGPAIWPRLDGADARSRRSLVLPPSLARRAAHA